MAQISEVGFKYHFITVRCFQKKIEVIQYFVLITLVV